MAATSRLGSSAVSLEGRQRVVLGAAGGIGIEDVGADGRALVTLNTPRAGILASLPGQSGERDFSWFDFSLARDLSAGGGLVLFHEAGVGASSTFHDTYTRKSDGSAAVRLGEGESWALSPDGRWALCVVHASPPRLELLPTGPRVYIQDVARGAPRAIAPEGFRATPAVTHDGRFILVRAPDRKLALLPADGGPVVPIAAVEPADIPIRFDTRGNLLVERQDPELTRLLRVAADTGLREVLREVKPPDLAGLESLGGFRVTADGRFYVYNYVRNLSDLYLVEGLK